MRWLPIVVTGLTARTFAIFTFRSSTSHSCTSQGYFSDGSLSKYPSFLNFSSPAPYITHSLATLLQQWPQTFFPNGHSISAALIPRHTLLYHGRHDKTDPPPSPEWLAFDVEMAYAIMGSMIDSRMLTYRTTKDVRAIYFDGMSASLMGEGTMSQMVFLYNSSDNVPRRGGFGQGPGRRPVRPPDRNGTSSNSNTEIVHGTEDKRRPGPPGGPGSWNPLADEYFRARGLCDWLSSKKLGGRGWGFEAIVRMNAGFELIWCDFESPSLQLISNLNVSVPRLDLQEDNSVEIFDENGMKQPDQQEIPLKTNDEGPNGPGFADISEPFRTNANWMWFTAATNRYNGEGRVKLDTCGLFSFYEPDLDGQSRARRMEDADRLNLTDDGHWLSPSEESRKSAALEELMKRRRAHHLGNVTKSDGQFMRSHLETRLRDVLEEKNQCSGTDWNLIAKEMMVTYAASLLNLYNIVKDTERNANDFILTMEWLRAVRVQTHWFLMPYLEYPPRRPYSKDSLGRLFGTDSRTAKHTLDRCLNRYSNHGLQLGDGERTFSDAITSTLAAICGVVVNVGMEVEYEWLSNYNTGVNGSKAHNLILFEKRKIWVERIEELMAWLGWVEQWTRCDEACGPGVSL